jgi:small-conductance mechanosensitive channel
MRAADVVIPGASYLSRHEHTLTAILTAALTLAAAFSADRWLAHRAERGVVGPDLATRVRFMRRLVTLAIVIVGVMFAVSQFGGLNRLATAVLASSAIVAAVVGFAARQTLANLVAGVMLTVAQPLRIGDQVTIEEHTGVVEDVRLNYTVLLGGDGRRMFIPNERLASSVLRNDTIIDPTVRPEVSLWLPPGADAERAVALLGAAEAEWAVRVAEVTADGVRLAVKGDASVAERAQAESAMRVEGLRVLRDGGLLRGSNQAGSAAGGPKADAG